MENGVIVYFLKEYLIEYMLSNTVNMCSSYIIHLKVEIETLYMLILVTKTLVIVLLSLCKYKMVRR